MQDLFKKEKIQKKKQKLPNNIYIEKINQAYIYTKNWIVQYIQNIQINQWSIKINFRMDKIEMQTIPCISIIKKHNHNGKYR